ncbi:MAG TPA: MATE family efflux transporter [Bacteroidales bacterium]|nr:MATE family efflux transporter [Bacteroidales bacterium]
MKDLTIGKESRLIITFALPMLLGNVFQQLYNIIDSIIVGNYIGEAALAAVGASFPITWVLIALVVGISMGSNVIIAQYYGAKDYENVKKAINTLFVFIFIAGIILTFIGLMLSNTLFRLLKLPAEIIPQATVFFNIYLLGITFMFGYNTVASILRGLGDSKTPLYFLILSTIINLLLDIVFVIGFRLGIASVAFATVISQCFSFIISLIYLNKHNKFFKISFKELTINKRILKYSLQIGIPSGLQQTFVGLGMLALLRIVNDFGTNAIAAYTVAGRIDSFAALPAMSFAAALSTFVGQNLGAHKPNRVVKGYFVTWLITSLISIFVMIIVIFFSKQLMGAFTNKKEVIEIGQSYLIIVCNFYILFSTMFVTTGVLRGAGDTTIPMFITLFSLWIIRVPLAYILSSSYVGLGINGVWWAIPLGWLFGCLFSYLYYLSGKWKNKVITKPINVVFEDTI